MSKENPEEVLLKTTLKMAKYRNEGWFKTFAQHCIPHLITENSRCWW